MNYFLGVDIGTSSVKSLLMDAKGHVVGSAQVGYDIIKDRPEYAEQDMEILWEASRKTIADVVKKYPQEAARIQGISYSGQMHGLVMTDAQGRLIRNAIIWADQRSEDEIHRIYDVVGEDSYRSVALNSLSTGFLISSLMWVKEHEPDNYEKIRHVMFPKDYIRFRMCGEYGTDMTDASSGAIFDTKRRRWAWELIDRLGIDRDIFPECHESCDVVGTVTKECAEMTGLKQGIKIACGGGDTLMQGVGNGIIGPGTLAANIGTACQISGGFNEPLYDETYRTNTFCHVKEDLWMLMGAHLSGGVALKWLMNEILYMDTFDEMTAMAAEAPAGSEGLVFLPYLSGERTPYNDPGAKGIYFGMTLRHGREHMIRSTMEGIVFGLRTSIEIFKGLGIEYSKIIASGGGARGRLFLEMQADIFDCDIYTNVGNEQAGIGAAITAAVASGEYADYEEACARLVHMKDTVVTPNRENQKYYEEQFAVYRELYGHNKDLFHM
ncbi:xylulokinase [Extibacter sp. GGCC_0201]|uniref:xylulokinase n=1 Tax=Extibacter sp. GGCC_0201 TaxID=2731209 RepID=UPI001AA153C3|nr:xylulokinase [Extibacter sp. GGCC_0201]MBO1721592.1 xylulokinase [Extibacter sp. GGCC_0201]